MAKKKDINWIYERHDIGVNQQYSDDLPYSFHLKMVVAVGKRYLYLLPKETWSDVILALAGHDLIEDARLTYNDVVSFFNKRVGDIIYSCTELRGHTRGERHGLEFIELLKKEKLGKFVKLCDIIANSTYSRVMGSSMFKKYQKELPKLKEELYVEGEYEDLWKELDLVLS